MISPKSKMAHDYELIAMSYHEASHTICGLFNFIHMYRVYVMSEKYSEGNALYESYDPWQVKDKILSKILCIFEIQTLYAGLVGEKIYYKEICGSDHFPMHLRIGSSTDMRQASKLINKQKLTPAGKNRVIFKRQIQNDVKNLLSDHWQDVKLIAHVLYKYKELNADEIKFFLTRKSCNKEFWKTRLKEIALIYNNKQNIEETRLKEVLLQNSVVIL